MQEIHQGDIIIIDAEPHAGKEIGDHDPKRNVGIFAVRLLC